MSIFFIMLNLLSGREAIEQDTVIKSQFKITKSLSEANVIKATHKNITLLIDAKRNFIDIKTKDESITVFHTEVESALTLYDVFDIDKNYFILINTRKLSTWLKSSLIQQETNEAATCYEFKFCSEQQVLPAFHEALKEMQIIMPKNRTAYQLFLAATA